MTDLLFDQILDELQLIHDTFPDLPFGAVLQEAVDTSKRGRNKNLGDLSSKEILTALRAHSKNHSAVRLGVATRKEERLERAKTAPAESRIE